MIHAAITGIGAVTPIGNTFSKSFASAISGFSGIGLNSRIDVSGIPWKSAGELRDFDKSRYLSPKEILRLDPFAQYAVAAAAMALEDAGLSPGGDYVSGGGVIIGSSRGGVGSLEKSMASLYEKSLRTKKLSAYLMPATTIGMASSAAAAKLGFRGHCLGISNACASGANAIGEAFRMIKNGYPGPLLAGGAEAPLCRISIEGYGSAGALSKIAGASASRPFDKKRDGFVLSEGACVLVMENLEEARKRGAKIYAVVAGYGNTCDAHHQIKPSRIGEKNAVEAAIAEAGITADEIDYISTHGTSTPLGDKVEYEALCDVFGRRADEIPASALKSLTGHMLAASGALEAAFTAAAIHGGIVPPSINLDEKDEKCPLNIITSAEKLRIRAAATGSYGFGGANAVLVLVRPD